MKSNKENTIQSDISVRRLSLVCNSCGGALSVDEESSVLICPFCGAREMLCDSESVEIEKTRLEAMKAIEIERIKSAERMKLMAQEQKLERDEAAKFKKRALSKVLVVGFVISVIFSILFFATSRVASGIFAAVQAVCCGLAWAMGTRLIKDKTRHLHTVCIIAAAILVIPVLGNIGNKTVLVEDTDWNVIFMREAVPEPSSKKFEIYSNTDTELELDIYNVSESDYYKYLAECKEMGYVNKAYESSSAYEAYNEQGFYIELSYFGSYGEMSLSAEAPAELYELNWDNHSISKVLPKPPSEQGAYELETEERTSMIVGGITKEQYLLYCDSCRELGFTVEETGYDASYSAFSAEGYELSIQYTEGNSQMSITLINPYEYTELKWPESGIGAIVPAPPSLSGRVLFDGNNTYSVHIKDMPRAALGEYVQECIEAGFSKNVNRYENSFSAVNSTGEELRVSYEGNNVISIYVKGSVSKDYY